MKDLWRMDNERGYWIRKERERASFMNCDSFWTFVQCSEKLKRTINDFETEKAREKHNRNIIQLYGATASHT